MPPRRKPPEFKLTKILTSPYFWAFALRFAILFFPPSEVRGDALDFQKIALNIAHGHGFSRCDHDPFPLTAERPPLYPMILSLFFASGLSLYLAPAVLNGILDFFSMRMVRGWASTAGFRKPQVGEWLIALCIPLLSYGRYATTENMSVFLFMGAVLAIFRRRWLLAGISFGLLSLCRSYMILFPPFLLIARNMFKMSLRNWAAMVLLSFLPAGVWMARNEVQLGVPEFSQGANFAWQSFQGLCRKDFDWWTTNDVYFMFQHPIFGQMFNSHCMQESELLALDRAARPMVWQCIKDQPMFVAQNVVKKGAQLYVGWGQFLPYTYVPQPYREVINVLIALLWISCLIFLARRWGKGDPKFRAATAIFIMASFYVGVVTIPFAIDARYVLAPMLGVLICASEASGSFRKLFQPLG
ncbi:MAG: hypothetical protein ACXWP5_06500 [Bdellovibrionota bacterium]